MILKLRVLGLTVWVEGLGRAVPVFGVRNLCRVWDLGSVEVLFMSVMRASSKPESKYLRLQGPISGMEVRGSNAEGWGKGAGFLI